MMNMKPFACVAAALVLGACDSPLDVDPTASIDAETAISTPRGVELAVNGAYRALQNGDLYGLEEMVFPDLYADNLDFTGTFQTHREVALRAIPASNGAVLAHWASGYSAINRVNNILAALGTVSGLTPAQSAQYRGEALFIRGLMYHMLVRYFGDVPLVLDPSRGVTEASLVSRAPAAEVYARIETDLEEAATLLTDARNNGRATRGAANALLARVYLDQGKNTQARDKAAGVIASGLYALNTTFRANWTTKNSNESIFELQYSINNSNSQSFWFYPQSLGGRWGFAPSLNLVNAFEAGDARLAGSIQTQGTQRYGFKYHRIANGDDNVVVLRLAEMYLIRAEANARIGGADAAAIADLNLLRARAGLAALAPTLTGASLLTAVLQERRVEMAFEGQRFFDLRRFGLAVSTLSITADRLLFPVPQAERDVNDNLTQNPGY